MYAMLGWLSLGLSAALTPLGAVQLLVMKCSRWRVAVVQLC